MVSELHGLSFGVRRSRRWKSCTFSVLPDFVAKTQDLSVPDSFFEEFSVPLLDDFVGDDRIELLMCPSVPSVPSGSTCPGRSSIIQGLRACSSRWDGGKRGPLVTRFPSDYALLSPWPTPLLQRRIVAL